MRQIITYISQKDGVVLDGLHPGIGDKLVQIAHLWAAYFPYDMDGLTITSGHEGHADDGVHKPTSFHYKGQAVDLRVRDVKITEVDKRFVPAVKFLLGSDYDVVWEGDHVHIEYDPKGTNVVNV